MTDERRRFALVVATNLYDDPDLQKLVSPAQDAEALASVLKDPQIGDFEVKVILNEPHYEISQEIESFLTDRERNDLLLIYFSCHGIKDKDGQLYFTAKNTRRKLLGSTAISANFVNDMMRRSRSRQQVLLLDCCFSGAFAKGMIPKSAIKQVNTADYFHMEERGYEGRGRVVLTASDAMQYSFEEDKLNGIGERSIFTYAMIQGLETGGADLHEDGQITYNELYDYVYENVKHTTSSQTPEMWVFGVQGNIVLAKNPNKRKTASNEDPNELIQDAMEYLKKGDYTSAVEFSNKAIIINPRFALAYNIKGQALFSLKKIDEAITSYQKALELRPGYIEALSNKGLALAEVGDHNKAIECFNQSIDLNPKDAIVWKHKGLSFHALGKYDDAIASFDKAINLNPNYIEALHNRETSLARLKEKEQKQLQDQAPTKDDSIRNVPQSSHIPSSPLANLTASPVSSSPSSERKEAGGGNIVNVEPTYRQDGEDAKPIDTETQLHMPPPSIKGTHDNEISEKGAPLIGSKPPLHTADAFSQIGEEGKKETVNTSKKEEYLQKPSSTKNSWKWIAIAGGAIGIILISVLATGLLSTTVADQYSFVRAWGSDGFDEGQFSSPDGIAVDSQGNVYVADWGNDRVQKFNSNGNFITSWGSDGFDEGQFYNPEGIAVDSQAYVYVTDSSRVQKFNSNGNFITSWGSYGEGEGQLRRPLYIAVDSQGNVYVADFYNDRVQKFNSNGNFITSWGSQGSGDGQFNNPSGIAVDSQGNVYVADNNYHIQKFNSNGNFITSWGSQGSGDGQFYGEASIAVDSQAYVYVTDPSNDRVQKFNSNGNFITSWGSQGSGDGQFNNPSGIAVDSQGNVYVADAGNDRVQVWAPSK